MYLFERLNVVPLGDRLHRERDVEKEYQRRLEESLKRCQPRIELPDHTMKEHHKTRLPRKNVFAEPNTPLLKRLVKNPKVLEVSRFKKMSSEKAIPERRPERALFANVAKQRRALSKNRGLIRYRAMDLYIKAATVKIPSVNVWLQHKNRLQA